MNASTKLLLLLLLTVLTIEGAHGQASSFTYQGQLRLSGEPFTGMADLEFRLYDQLSDGTQIGGAQSRPTSGRRRAVPGRAGFRRHCVRRQ